MFAALLSVSVEVTVAVLETVVIVVSEIDATTVTVAVAAAAKLPTLTVILLPTVLTVPTLGVTETTPSVAGSTSLIVTPLASDGPLLVTSNV